VSFAEAAVFPSCLTTASYALFMRSALALDLPPLTGHAEQKNQSLIVWGGSSVVGSTAIQLATLAGYTVVATSSPHNFEHCRSLGAEKVFDYKSERVVEDVVAACESLGGECVGAFVAYYNDDSAVSCSRIVSGLKGKRVVGTVAPPGLDVPKGVVEGVRIVDSEFFFPVPLFPFSH
jgi:D-arabinose 1-dehydrogenase-like Zn-dependent alcohol dehydrogenase